MVLDDFIGLETDHDVFRQRDQSFMIAAIYEHRDSVNAKHLHHAFASGDGDD